MATIQIGIDLGTTNSAIAVNHAGKIEIIKNFDRDEFTPSVFWFDKAKNPLVGKRAFEKLYKYADPEDLVNFRSEIKRLMGTPEITYFPRVEKNLKAEEISAEILKYLKSTALKQYSDLDTTWVVITIPAHFSTLESEATKRAGELAWFQQVVLLQEPIAAAIAYGFDNKKNASWLVYDLWGGTFDTAIIQSKDGLLNILASKWDNFLWWKDFDWAIVDQIFVPKILEKFQLLNFSRWNEKYRNSFNILKGFAENAKKMLTYDENINVEIDKIGDDDLGKPIYLDIPLSRKEFEEIISPFIKKSLSLVRETIKESGIQKDVIEKIVLVWWSTQTPYISQELKREFWIPVDSWVDPLTVVAHGASVYAQTQVISDEFKTSDKSAASAYKIALNYEAVTTDEEEMLTGTVSWTDEEEMYVQIQSESWYFSSNKTLVRNGKFIVNLRIEEWKVNQYWIYLFDSRWNTVETNTDGFSITHWLSVGSIPIPLWVGVAIAKQSSGLHWTEQMYWYFNKNDKLPLKKTQTFKTSKPLQKDSKSNALPIKIFEGESDIPDRNTFICELWITGESLPYDLDIGTPVEVEINIDKSRQLSVNAYIPSIDLKLDVRKTTLDEKIEIWTLTEEMGKEIERYNDLKNELSPKQKEELDEDVEYIQNTIANAEGDEDEKRKSNKKLKDFKRRLDILWKETEYDKLLSNFNELCESLDDVFVKLWDTAGYKIQDLENRYRTIRKGGEKAVDEKDKVLLLSVNEQLDDLQTTIFMESIKWWERLYKNLRDGGYSFEDNEDAEYLFKKGDAAIKSNDKELLENCVRELVKLVPKDEQGRVQWGNLSGITL